MPAPRYPILASWLRRYFYSGWAFLMPYLFAYLLYYATGWSVNAASSAAAGNGSEVIGNGAIEATTHNLSPIASHLGSIPIPCLLHLYWALHAIHAILAGVALWSWWSHERAKVQVPSTKCQSSTSDDTVNPTADLRPLTADLWPLASGFSSIAMRLAPWALLALLFYIPGVYLEWPSDPWEHLRRINEWRILDTVGAHSSWTKSAYFIPYSLLSWCIGLRQLFWLDYYYTGICLLLCWQYYRFSRACGLGERASMVFVIIQALLFGNNIFSFYRYYGISSSIYAQLGAVALTRIVLEFAARGTKLQLDLSHRGHGALTQSSQSETDGMGVGAQTCCALPVSEIGRGAPDEPVKGSNSISEKIAKDQWSKTGREYSMTDRTDKHGSQRLSPIAHHPSPITDTPLAPGLWPLASNFWHLPTVFWLLAPVSCLLALTALNHVQGLGIAGLGIAAVCIWRLIEWKRSALWWLIGITITINALFLWLYHRPPIIETYRAQGYLNAWYGFNILDFRSPAGDRMLQIVSAFGLFNLVFTFLLPRNHVVFWLTAMPLLLLITPAAAGLLAVTLASHGNPINIITFQRLLFCIPIGLSFSLLSSRILIRLTPNICPTVAIVISLTFIICLPASSPQCNRTWQLLAQIPADLQMSHFLSLLDLQDHSNSNLEFKHITTISPGAALQAAGAPNVLFAYRTIGITAGDSAAPALASVADSTNRGALVYVPNACVLTSPISFAGRLSGHWSPQEVAVANVAGAELEAITLRTGAFALTTSPRILYKLQSSSPNKE